MPFIEMGKTGGNAGLDEGQQSQLLNIFILKCLLGSNVKQETGIHLEAQDRGLG